MRRLGGKVNPSLVQQLLKRALDERA